jgi:hypothetical protein
VTSITLLTQADCVLCEHAKGVLARVGADHPLEVTEIELASEHGRVLAARPGLRAPRSLKGVFDDEVLFR